ncbi:MAG: hypothetical protein R3250_01440 [Melioribacteraceae bacterium]|nr:hypothetical protein [Melioribacteraceae bacterium]
MTLRITPTKVEDEEYGIWTEYYGIKLRIARSTNTKFKKEFRRLTKPYQKEIDEDRMQEEKSSAILAEAMAKAILVDWKDFVVNGKEVEYSIANAIDLLTNDEDCRTFVSNFAGEIDNYIIEEMEKVSGEA